MNKDGIKAIFIRTNGSFNRYYAKDPYHVVIQEELTHLYGNTVTIPEMVYLFLNDRPHPPLCPSCKTTVPLFISIPRGYREYCTNSKCKQANIQAVNLRKYGTPFPSRLKEFQDKAKETNKEKYGVSNPMQNKDVRSKAISSMIKKYGVANPSQSASIQEKKAQNSLDKYGVRSPLMSPEVKEKIKESNQRNHGVDYPMQSKEIQNKSKETVRDRYGVDYIVQDAYTHEKIQNTLLERYGTRQYFASEHAKTAIKATNIERYGVPYPMQLDRIKEKSKRTNLLKYGFVDYNQIPEARKEASAQAKSKYYQQRKEDLKDTHVFLFTEEEYIANTLPRFKFPYRCVACNTEYSKRLHFATPRCPVCYPSHKSLPEMVLREFLIDLGLEVHTNRRDVIPPMELDIFLPEKNIAIEMNGVYWHSDKYLSPSYHKDKLIRCREQGIRLIQIFEDQWIGKRDRVLSRLGSILGSGRDVIMARKCSVEVVGIGEAKEFLNTNHLQGYTSDLIRYGLRHQGELVALMTFQKPLSPDYEWEMVRFCTRMNVRVVGGASRLLTRFIREYSPETVLTYSDLCWVDGNMYRKLGFELIKETEPGYFYAKSWGKIKRMRPTGGNPVGAIEFHKVYDCGQGVWVRKIRK